MKLSGFIPEPFKTLKLEYDKLKELAKTLGPEDLRVQMAANKVFLAASSCISAVVVTVLSFTAVYLSPTWAPIALIHAVAMTALIIGGEARNQASFSLATGAWSLVALGYAIRIMSPESSLYYVAAAIGGLALHCGCAKIYQTLIDNVFKESSYPNKERTIEQMCEEVETNLRQNEDYQDIKVHTLIDFNTIVHVYIKSKFMDLFTSHSTCIAAIIDYATPKLFA